MFINEILKTIYMFELELLELLNELKNSTEDYDSKKIKNSICNLIRQNIGEYEKFTQSKAIDPETINILRECENIIEKENENHEQSVEKEERTDFEIIKEQYFKWLEIYNNNNKQLIEQNTQIVNQIINFYVQNRFEVIEQILKIEDSEDWEAFKWHIKNNLRVYFGEKIMNYLESEKLKSLSFFKRRRKKYQALELANEIGNYNFDKKEIDEVLS